MTRKVSPGRTNVRSSSSLRSSVYLSTKRCQSRVMNSHNLPDIAAECEFGVWRSELTAS